MIPGCGLIGGGGSPLATNAALWLEFEGANGSTPKDWSATPKTITLFGNAQINSNELLLDGNGDYGVAGVAADWKFLHDYSIPWTWEGRFKFSSFSTYQVLLATSDTTAAVGIVIYVTTGRQIAVHIYHGTSGTYVFNGTTTSTIPNDSNEHDISVDMDPSLGSNQLKVFIDGTHVQSFSKTLIAPSSANPQYTLHFGCTTSSGTSGNINGRITGGYVIHKGFCIWSSNYTPRRYI